MVFDEIPTGRELPAQVKIRNRVQARQQRVGQRQNDEANARPIGPSLGFNAHGL